MRHLTPLQKDELITQYSELIIDSMDYKSLEAFVKQTLTQDLQEVASREELCVDIECTFDEETLNELIDNVTNQTVTTTEVNHV